MRAMLIAFLLVSAMVVMSGCPRGAHAVLAGAAVGLVAADALHHAAHRSYYRGYYYNHYDPYVDVHYTTGYGYPTNQTVYYSRPATHVYYSSYPRVTYHSPRPTRVVTRPPVRYTSPRPSSGGSLSTRWSR